MINPIINNLKQRMKKSQEKEVEKTSDIDDFKNLRIWQKV